MIKVRISHTRFPADLIPDHEFHVLPSIGCSIRVLDKNSNSHYLKVCSVRQLGVNPESELPAFSRNQSDQYGILLVCENDVEWKKEISE